MRTPVTMVILLGILLGAAFYGWSTIAAGGGDDEPEAATVTTPRRECKQTQTYPKGTRIKARTVTVNVYNAGVVTGLATETLQDLADKGFRAGEADNAPAGISATNVTIMTTTRNSPQVRLVAKQFLGKVKILNSQPLSPGVSVIVGDQFRGVDDGAKRRLVLRRDVTTCTKGPASAQPE